MDFTQPHDVGSRVEQLGSGIDHCYVIDRSSTEPGALVLAAKLTDPNSGRILEIHTTEPGVQLYTGNFLDGSPQSGGFEKHAALCLECQHFPDSPNRPSFPSTLLEPGEIYKQTTVHSFSVEK